MYLTIKTTLDKFIAIVLLILLLPLFLIISIVLKINNVSPIFFVQKRSGKNNIDFKIYKYRTIDKNRKINKFCSFLRNTGLDEIPQLINIIKGEMSFIGPRAWITDYSKYYTEKQKKRLKVLPGITGLAQVSKCKNVFEKIEKDCYYVDNISFLLDLKILIKTFITVFTKSKDKITEKEIQKEIEDLKHNKKRKK